MKAETYSRVLASSGTTTMKRQLTRDKRLKARSPGYSQASTSNMQGTTDSVPWQHCVCDLPLAQTMAFLFHFCLGKDYGCECRKLDLKRFAHLPRTALSSV